MKQFFANLREQDIRNVLAIIIVIGTFTLQHRILSKGIPKDNHDIAVTTVVLTFGMQAAVLAYFFGASKIDRKNQTTP